jgi:hypothetical protein
MMLELLAVLFFGVAMAGYPCCCKKCDCCRPVKSYIIVTFSGVANDNCTDCGNWSNVAWELARDTGVGTGQGQCTFSLTEGLPCGF